MATVVIERLPKHDYLPGCAALGRDWDEQSIFALPGKKLVIGSCGRGFAARCVRGAVCRQTLLEVADVDDPCHNLGSPAAGRAGYRGRSGYMAEAFRWRI
jgi:hypothetical protein